MAQQLLRESSYYNANIDKIIKIQSFIRIRYWLLPYLNIIKPLIKKLFEREKQKFINNPTMFGDNSEENIKMLEIAFRQRQKQMKEGHLAQIVIGNWYGWEDLGTAHPSGLDCRKKDNSIIMDSKNKYNTTNSDSEKSLLDKLSKYKKENPKTQCIWGISIQNLDVKNSTKK